MEPTNLDEVKNKADDFKLIAAHRESLVWFWKQQATKEMAEMINRVDEILGRIQKADMPRRAADIVRAGAELEGSVQELIDRSEKGSILQKMMIQFKGAMAGPD